MTALTYSMRTIIPLRVAGVLSSIFFIVYGMYIQSWPVLLTELVILPLNLMRLIELMRLLRQVEQATGDEFDVNWLEPFSTKRRMKGGEVLFRSGDVATELYVVHSGLLRLEGRDMTFGPGALTGELGFLSPDNRRTGTLVCAEEGEVGVVSYFNLKQLYFQNPKFGFYLLKLIAGRLFENEARARGELLLARAAD